MGEAGPLGVKPRDVGMPEVIDEDLGGSVKEFVGDDGCVGGRDIGCWRIRRRPDIPSPRSCSPEMGDLSAGSWADPASKEIRSFPSSAVLLLLASKSPVLLFFGILSMPGSASDFSSSKTICCGPESTGGTLDQSMNIESRA